MALLIRLLGPSRVEADGESRSLGGRKAWGLIAYLLLEPRGATRRELAERLCAEADDPLATLRWHLLQARRALAPAGIVETDSRLTFQPSSDAVVDALTILEGTGDPDEIEELCGGPLLEGMSFDDAPAFDHWLSLQRSRVATAAADSLRWAATMMARVEPQRSLSLIDRALLLDPFDDSLHSLAVDIHVARGDRAAADAYVERLRTTYRSELAIDVPEGIMRALSRAERASVPAAPETVTARTLLGIAEKRLAAGDFDRAIDTARRAVASAAASGDRGLEARAIMMLAGTLIHTLHGRDHESYGLLARALELATGLGDAQLLADVEREFGFIGLIDARYGAAEAALTRSMGWGMDAGDPALAAKARTFRGMCASDRADYERAEHDLLASIDALRPEEHRGYRGYTRAGLARVQLLTGRIGEARSACAVAAEEVESGGYHGSLPWVLFNLSEAALLEGDEPAARAAAEQSWALAVEFADPCWECLALRALSLSARAEGAMEEAWSMLEEGLARARRVTDTYRWAEALLLTELVELEEGRDEEHLRDAVRLVFAAPMPAFAERLRPYMASEQTRLQTPAP